MSRADGVYDAPDGDSDRLVYDLYGLTEEKRSLLWKPVWYESHRISPEPKLDRTALKKAIVDGRVEWQLHALRRLLARGISRSDVFAVLRSGEQIEDYPDDRLFPSALFLGWMASEPLHVVAVFDSASQWATAARPPQ